MTSALFMAAPAMAQVAGTPAFRVPMGSNGSASSAPATFAWVQSVGTCSNACGDGTRTATYQCQNVSDYDFSGSGYGAPESDASCSAAGGKPTAQTAACTNYAGCSYDWVKPPVATTIIEKPDPAGGTFPAGAVADCSYAKRVFSPFCQRTGANPVQMPAGDHAFCRFDTPDYDDVAANRTDALGYDRTTEIKSACTAGSRDYGWKTGAWVPGTATCSATNTETRSVQCVLKFNGSSATDAMCAGIAKPAATQPGTANYSSCSYVWKTGEYGSWNNTCSQTATHVRSVVCRRSDGTDVADSSCSNVGAKPATSESGANYVGCSYSWTTPTAWTPAQGCSANLAQTRSTTCQRSDGTGVAESSCSAGSKPATSQTVANYDTCTYAPRDQGASTCTAQGSQQQYWDCTRSDGATGYPASYCGKTNPETRSCTPSKSPYTARDRGYGACDASGQRPHYWDCTGFDGSTGNPAANCGHSNPEMEACSFTAVNGGTTACNASGQQTTTWSCRGNQDGQTYPATYCGHQASEVTSCAAPVSYSPRDRGQSACQSNNTLQQYWDCQGTDGQIYPANYCGKTNPETRGCTYVPPVSYAWQAAGWSAYGSNCSDSATRTRAVWCQNNSGATVADANCGGGRPTDTESTGVYSGCTYASSDSGAPSACTNGTQTVPLQCRRSDGVVVANSNCGTGTTRTQSCSSLPTMCAMAPRYRFNSSGSAANGSGAIALSGATNSFQYQAPFNSNGSDYPCGRTLRGSGAIVSNGASYNVSASCASSGGPSCDGYENQMIDGVNYRTRVYVSNYGNSSKICTATVTIDATYNGAATNLPNC
jgi:hypothetical protein